MARKKKKSGLASRKIARRDPSTRVYKKKCSCGKGVKASDHVLTHYRCPPGKQLKSKPYQEGKRPSCKGGATPVLISDYGRCHPRPGKPRAGCGKPR